MLNTVMTVRQGEANSHAKRGWEAFTDQTVKILNKEKSGLVFLLWGKPAMDKGVSMLNVVCFVLFRRFYGFINEFSTYRNM